MTDSKTATERICELLEAVGVSFVRSEEIIANTYWGVTWFVGNTKFEFRENNERTDMIAFNATPEQAIAATLGSGECEVERIAVDEGCERIIYSYICRECNYIWWSLEDLDFPCCCPSCGRRVKR